LAIILAMADTLSLAAVKDRFSEIVDRVNKQHDRVIVTRNGVPVVVVVSVEEFESLEETLEILSDRDTVAALHESEQQIAEGLDEVITEGNARARWIR
jgi:antitoxin YefM